MNKEKELKLIYEIEQDFNYGNITLIDILEKYKELPRIDNYDGCKYLSKNDNIKYYKEMVTEDCSIIVKYNNLINAMNDVRNYPDFMDLDLNIQRPLFKLVYDRFNNPIIFVTKLDINEIGDFNSFRIYGLYGEATKSNERLDRYNYLILNGISRVSFNTIEISTIEVNKYFRAGRGSLLIRYLENDLIQGFNKELEKPIYNYSDIKIKRIEGIIGGLGTVRNSYEHRVKFYLSNGFKVEGRKFYKNLNK